MKNKIAINDNLEHLEYWHANFFFHDLQGATNGPPVRYSLEQRNPLAMFLILARAISKKQKIKSVLDISSYLYNEVLESIPSMSSLKEDQIERYIDNNYANKKFDLIILSTSYLHYCLRNDKHFTEEAGMQDIQEILSGNKGRSYFPQKIIVFYNGLKNIMQHIIDNNLNKDGKLILIDEIELLKGSTNSKYIDDIKNNIFVDFKETNSYRLYASVFNYTVENIYDVRDAGKTEKFYDDCEIRLYVLNSHKTSNHFVYIDSNRDLRLFDKFFNSKSFQIKNIFPKKFKYPGNTWFDDDVFNWEIDYYMKSRFADRFYKKILKENRSKIIRESNYANNLIKYRKKYKISEKFAIESQLFYLERFDDVQFKNSLSFSIGAFTQVSGNTAVYYPKSLINEFIQIFDGDVFKAMFYLKQEFKFFERSKDYGHEYTKYKDFLEVTDFNQSFRQSIESISSKRSENQPKHFQIIYLDLTIREYDPDDLFIFLSNSLKLVDPNNKHCILIWCNEDILISDKYIEFRETFSNNILSVIKLDNYYLLRFQKGNVEKFLSASFSGEAFDSDNKFKRSMDKLRVQYDNRSLFFEKNEMFANDWSVKFNKNFKKSITNEDLSNQIHDFDKRTMSGQRTIISKIDKMMSEIENVKSLTQDNIDSIETSIDQILGIVEQHNSFERIESYVPEIKKWFNYWDIIEEQSKLFMPRSEYLRHTIDTSPDFDDYSPFVLYYSRVLEVELFQKIFRRFNLLIKEKFTDVESLFNYDENLSKKIINSIEVGPINSFKYKILKDDSKYNLGDMRLILDLLPDSNKPQGSKRYQILEILKELHLFINDEIGGIPKELVSRIKTIITEFRNPSAHVGIISKDQAKTFFEEYKKVMNQLIGLFDKK